MTEPSTEALDAKRRERDELQGRVRDLDREIGDAEAESLWRPTSYYATYYALTGSLLGLLGAMTSLLFNVIGAPLAGKSPLELIQVYLTFPLGEAALNLSAASGEAGAAAGAAGGVVVPAGVLLATGVSLYLFTGMLLGIPVYLVLTRFTHEAGLVPRLVVGIVAALAVWAVNFYGILSWLQPALFGGTWITSGEHLPVWVAAATHVVFGATIAIAYPLGQYRPYERPMES